MQGKVMIAPSIFAADMTEIGKAIESAEERGADVLHLDVMDGVFVPNISFVQKTVADIKRKTRLPLDVHLMIVEPERYIDSFIDAGADYLTVHFEATKKLGEIIKSVKARGVKVGVSVKPNTDIMELKPYLDELDLILIMSVEPGFSGQKYMQSVEPKLEWLKENKGNHNYIIEIDGGINDITRERAVACGAEMLVMGSAFFK